MFLTHPAYDIFRTLRLTPVWMRGEDVYALQTALKELGAKPGSLDGILGVTTSEAISRGQKVLGVKVDGKAGGDTQQAICKRLANVAAHEHGIPDGLVFGHIMHESSCRLGIYTPPYSDGSYDAGACQRNTRVYSDVENSYNIPFVIDFLGEYDKKFYGKFLGVKDVARRWALSAGAWNRPAYAGWIANEEGAKVPRSEIKKPTDSERGRLEAYMASAVSFLNLHG